MAEEKKGLTVKKEENFSEWFSQIVSEQGANLADIRYNVQGFIVHMPYAFRILRKMYEYLEEEVEKDGHEPFLFPTVIPKENLMKEKEHAGFAPDVFWIDKAGDAKLEKVLALRPTGETALYPMYSLWIRSYNDLPFKRYQSRITVFRNEKTTRPFLRGREFMFFESHDVFRSHEEAMKQIEKDGEISRKVIWERLKIPFLNFKRPKWDKFKGADDTYTPDTLMPDGKRNQLASTHDLGQNFAKAYDVTFLDESGKKQYAWQTCYGPGIWRMMAALIGIHGDDTGLVLPFDVAPVQIVIIPIVFSNDKAKSDSIIKSCKEIAEQLEKDFRVKVDDSPNTPGFKFNYWEMMGVPIRVEIGPRDLEKKQATILRRTAKAKEFVKMTAISKALNEQAELLDSEIEERAKKYFSNNTKDAESYAMLKELLEKFKGFVRVPWCSIGLDGEHCAEKLKDETNGGSVAGTIFPKEEKVRPGAKCIVCGKPAKHMVYVCKSY